MAEHEVGNSEEVEWAVVEQDDVNGEEIEAQEGPIYVAMQPGVDIPAGVEVHEVVIVTEGSESVQEVAQQPQQQPEVNIPAAQERHELATLLRDENLLKRRRETPKIKIKKKQSHLMPFEESLESPEYEYDNTYETPSNSRHGHGGKSVSRGRPKGSKNIVYKQPTPRSRSSTSLRSPPVHIKQESSSETSESESDDDDMEEPDRKRPKPRDFAHRLQWRNKDMLDAMKTVQDKKYTIRGAAKKFSVPYSTLKDRVHGRVRHGTKPGVKTVLSPEEEEDLVRFVKDMEQSGFQLKCMDVRDRAAEMLRVNHGQASPYKEGSPGHNWLAGFLKRHPGLEFKRSVNRNIVPSLNKQKQMVRRFFDIVANVYKKHKMNHHGNRIFSVSELRLTGILQATILYATSADGVLIPPFVIYKGRQLGLKASRQAYPSAFFTCCYDGRVNEDSFLWWFRDHFMKHASSNTRSSVLFIDRGIQDITLQLAQLTKEERVNLISLPRGVQHLLQPLDMEMNESISNMITKRLEKFQTENPNEQLSQKVIAHTLQKVWKKINPQDIMNRFGKNGLYPLNTQAIGNDRIMSASHLLREAYNQEPAESGNSPLANLNLLALSSHRYASINQLYGEGRAGGGGSVNQSFDQESDTSLNNGDHQQTPSSHYSGRGDYSSARGHSALEHGIELEEVPIEENVVMEDNVIEEPVEFGEEIIDGSHHHQDVKNVLALRQEQMQMKPQQPPRIKPSRPNTNILQRHVNVQSEITEAKNNPEQINRAINSILVMEAQQEDDVLEEQQVLEDNIQEEIDTSESHITTIKQEGTVSVSSHNHQQQLQQVRTVNPSQGRSQFNLANRPTMHTLRLIDGKIINESGREMDFSGMNQDVEIEVKVDKDDEAVGGMEMTEEELTEQQGESVAVEDLSNLNQEQIDRLISSGMIQAVEPHDAYHPGGIQSIVQTEDGQYVQVYEDGSTAAATGELPQQIFQGEEMGGQSIVIDQDQLQQMLLDGGQVMAAEEDYEDPVNADSGNGEPGNQKVHYIQLPDGSIQQITME